jgi:hypothetical protein
MKDQTFYNTVSGLAVLVVIASFGVGIYSGQLGGALPGTNGSGHPQVVAYLNLTVSINSTTGWPQYAPANFTVPRGEVKISITDDDSMMAWSTCLCQVAGTVNNLETVNGTAMGVIPSADVAHTFSIPALGLNLPSPGQSIVATSVWFNQTGSFTWLCEAPCGAGPDPYDSAPMGVPGYITGTLTVQ